ncbi:MAG: hypothetical protein CMJ46_09275 [Planctomyces sp.]|nr:hypothetical protein [Planctomyces sp.]
MTLPADSHSAETSLPPDHDLLLRVSQRYWQALPLVDFANGLQHVVESLWEESDADALLLLTPDPEEKSLWFCFYDQTRSLLETSDRFPCPADWAENFLGLIDECWRDLFSDAELGELEFTPLHTTGPVRGMLISATSSSHSVDGTSPFAHIADITCRFLEQVRLAHHPASLVQLQELKLASLAEFAAGAGHEINNPLATISGRAQLLLKEETDPERREMLSNIGAQALRIRDMIGDLMLFGRPPAPNLESVSLSEVVEEVTLSLMKQHGERIRIDYEPSCEVVLQADQAQLELVVRELIENGLQNTAEGESPQVSILTRMGFDNGVQIQFASPGSRLSALDEQHLFDPFYSGRQAGRGLGFGLSKAWQIVHQHAATISVRHGKTGGTTVTLHWPGEAVK